MLSLTCCSQGLAGCVGQPGSDGCLGTGSCPLEGPLSWRWLCVGLARGWQRGRCPGISWLEARLEGQWTEQAGARESVRQPCPD